MNKEKRQNKINFLKPLSLLFLKIFNTMQLNTGGTLEQFPIFQDNVFLTGKWESKTKEKTIAFYDETSGYLGCMFSQSTTKENYLIISFDDGVIFNSKRLHLIILILTGEVHF